jgi:hypothetical protein
MNRSKESSLAGRVKHVRLHWRVRSCFVLTLGPYPSDTD